MIESEEKALSILNSLEEICSDLERAMRILRKGNTEIANALCRILVKFFWEMEYPILETRPSLHSTAKIGAKYKDCAVYKIIQYHTISKEYNIIKSGIPPEDSRRTLTEIRNAQVMPYATGIMQNDQTFTDVRKKGNYIDALIIVDAPQARRLYYNPQFDFQTAKNPNAGAGWFEMWGEGGKYEDFFRNAYEKNFRKELRK